MPTATRHRNALRLEGIRWIVNVAQEINYDVPFDFGLIKYGGVIAGLPIRPFVTAIASLVLSGAKMTDCLCGRIESLAGRFDLRADGIGQGRGGGPRARQAAAQCFTNGGHHQPLQGGTRMRTTHTYVVMNVSPQAFDEIRQKLVDADYMHAIHDDGHDGELLDMYGIALAPASEFNSYGRCYAHDMVDCPAHWRPRKPPLFKRLKQFFGI